MLPLSKESIEARARAMFLAYLSVTGNKNVRGEDVPPWEALPQKVKDAWIAAQDAERQDHAPAVARPGMGRRDRRCVNPGKRLSSQ